VKISKKEWNSYINKLAKISDVAVGEMTAYIKLHPHASRYSIISMANAIATKYGEVNGSLSCQMYDEIANRQKVKIPPAEMAPTVTMKESAKMVNSLFKKPLQIPNAVGRQVKQVGADTMLKNARRDGAEFAWIASGDGCAYCKMISSRGWQHASAKTIKGDHAEHIHNRCKCEFAIRFDGKSQVEGYNPDKLLKEFENTEGETWEKKVNAIRRKTYAINKKHNIEKDDYEALLNQISLFYNKKTQWKEIPSSTVYNLGILPKIKGINEEVHGDIIIEGYNLNKIMSKHGNEFSFEEFKLLQGIITTPDYIADNQNKHQNSLLLYGKIPKREKSIMECVIIKKDNKKFVIHYHKIRKNKIEKLQREGKLLYKRK